MVASEQTPAVPEPSGQIAGNGDSKNEPDDWTSYSAGKPATDSVIQAAENPATSADILGMLAESCNVEVRMAVAHNPSALLETVTALAQDESDDLRYQLAENHNIHESVLILLAKDPHPYVAHRAKTTLARLGVGAAVLVYPVPEIAPVVSITKSANAAELRSRNE